MISIKKYSHYIVLTIIFIISNYFHPIFSQGVFNELDNKSFNNEKDSVSSNNNLSIKLKDYPYYLGPGDEIEMKFFGLPEFNTKVLIDQRGYFKTQRIKDIFVIDLTLYELNKKLTDAYKDFIREPLIDLKITKYKPIRSYIGGEVLRPGFYTVSNQDGVSPTVFDGIKTAGGLTPFSDISKVEVYRFNKSLKNKFNVITINLEDFLDNNFTSNQNIPLSSKDRVIITKIDDQSNSFNSKSLINNLSPRYIEVNIQGAVRNPGNIKVLNGSNIKEVLKNVGGKSVYAGTIQHTTMNKEGETITNYFNLNEQSKKMQSNSILQEGDIIYVNNNILGKVLVPAQEITSPFVGIYAAIKLLGL